jgi:hypothetical protein
MAPTGEVGGPAGDATTVGGLDLGYEAALLHISRYRGIGRVLGPLASLALPISRLTVDGQSCKFLAPTLNDT